MKALALVAFLCLASAASGQSIFTPGYSGGVGPWQPSRVAPTWNYYHASAPIYPVAAGYGRSYDRYLREETLIQLEQINQRAYRPRYYGRGW